MARLWFRALAAASMDFGRPTLERNHFRNVTTQSTHISVEIPSRSNSGSRFAGIAPRLSLRKKQRGHSTYVRKAQCPLTLTLLLVPGSLREIDIPRLPDMTCHDDQCGILW